MSEPARSPAAGTWFAGWIVNRGEPTSQRAVDPPRPAIAHVELYDWSVVDVLVDVVATGSDKVCVRQAVEHGDTRWWLAWVDRDRVCPADAEALDKGR